MQKKKDVKKEQNKEQDKFDDILNKYQSKLLASLESVTKNKKEGVKSDDAAFEEVDYWLHQKQIIYKLKILIKKQF